MVWAASACGPTAAPKPRPDVVLYVVDTLRPDRLSTYGHQRKTSPHLTELAQESVLFRQAYSTSSWTKAATASILTGLDPLQHGARTQRNSLPEQAELISETLHDAGYFTAAIVTNPNVVEDWGFVQGYDVFRDLGEDLPAGQGFHDIRAERVHQVVFEILQQVPEGRPLFLYVHTIDPHAPYDPPKPYHKKFSRTPGWSVSPARLLSDELSPEELDRLLRNTRSQYDGEVRYMDDRLGEFLDGLRQRGRFDDTMFWFVSDHGDEHLEHEGAGHGFRLFNESVRVPLLWRLPQGAHGGREVTEAVQVIDVVPSTLAWLGIPPSLDAEGLDLRPLVEGAPAEPRPLFFDLELQVGTHPMHAAHGVLLGDYKYIEEMLPVPGRFLFHLATDPKEEENLLGVEPELASELEEILNAHRRRFQHGLFLNFAGDGARPLGWLEATVSVSGGQIVEVNGTSLEQGDGWTIDQDRRTLHVKVQVADLEDNLLHEPFQDLDGISLDLEPPDAPVIIESVRWLGDADRVPIFLGKERVPADPPLETYLLDPRVMLGLEDLLFQVGVRSRVPAGLYVTSRPDQNVVDSDSLTEEMRRRLEELGYLSGH